MPQPSPAEKLAALRAELARQSLAGFLIPRADEHLGEYVPARADRLRWLTGFSGSAGLAAVLADKAAAFTDGRYVLQLAEQTDPALWERRHITDEPLADWLAQHTAPGGSFATYTAAGHVRRALQSAGFDVQRLPGHGKKRHMTAGNRP